MAETVKGINIKLSLDGRDLENELKVIKSDLKEQEKDLKAINQNLKYDSSNLDLWKSKQEKLNNILHLTKKRLDTQNLELEKAKKAVKLGELSETEFNKMKRNVSYTEAQISKLNNELEKTKSNIHSLGNANFDKISKIGSTLTKSITVPVIGAVTALGVLAKKSADTTDNLSDTSAKLGLSVEALQEWNHVATLSGVSTESLNKGFVMINSILGDISTGNGGKVVESLSLIGLSIDDLKGKNADTAFETIRNALSNIKDESIKVGVANQFFGDKIGSELLPLLNAEKSAITELRKEAVELGIITSEQAKITGAFNDTLDQVKQSATSLGVEISVVVLPIMQALLEKVRDEIIPTIKSWVDKWNNLDESTKGIIVTIGTVITALGPFLMLVGKVGPILNMVSMAFKSVGTSGLFAGDGNSSIDIDFSIEYIDKDLYQCKVTPSDLFMKNAIYPVVIDPEITLADGGWYDGIITKTVVNKETGSVINYDIGNMTLKNKTIYGVDKSTRAYLGVNIPSVNDAKSYRPMDKLIDKIFSYAYLEMPTAISSTPGDSSAVLKLVNSMQPSYPIQLDTVFTTTEVDRQDFHAGNNLTHKFNIYEVLKDKIVNLENDWINLLFELEIQGPNNAEVTYQIGYDLTGPEPVLHLGYHDESGLADYFTYEEIPVSESSNAYVAHNSGNLTYVFQDFLINDTINLSHIYNTNERDVASPYGKGFNINYNESIVQLSSSILQLTLGNGRIVNFVFTNTENGVDTYLAMDGSGDKLCKNSTLYLLYGSDGTLKRYNNNGKLEKIYNHQYTLTEIMDTTEPKYLVEIIYTNGFITKIKDYLGNYISLEYFDGYLNHAYIYKKTGSSESSPVQLAEEIYYEVYDGYLRTAYIFNQSQYYGFDYYDQKLYSIYDGVSQNSIEFLYDNNRVIHAEYKNINYDNGNYLDFIYDSNGKRVVVNDGNQHSMVYTFDSYYHTVSIEDSKGYTTFYKYNDIYHDENGNVITTPNYNKNYKTEVVSSPFKNTISPIYNHGFEIVNDDTSTTTPGWIVNSTGSSFAKINKLAPLYGSRVLELYKDSSGSVSVYQDVLVETGKEYIVSGYIMNNNTGGSGAKIQAIAQGGGTIQVKPNGYNPVINSKGFVYYEVKFVSNYSGLVRINLVNGTNGSTFFDQIQISTNYIDTRYNYLENSSFEFGSKGWNINDNTIVNNNIFRYNCGNKSIKLNNEKDIIQSINKVGEKGDIFVFGGYAFYENYQSSCTFKLRFHNNLGVEEFKFSFDPNNPNEQYLMNKAITTQNYYLIEFIVSSNNENSYVYLDNLALYKEGYGTNITYNDFGYVEGEVNEVTGETKQITYDENNYVKTFTTNGETVIYNYENNRLSEMVKNNTTTRFERDSNGNIISIISKANNEDEIIVSNSTQYTADGVFVHNETDNFGNITTYNYSYLTGLIDDIIKENGVTTSYEYFSNGKIKSMTTGDKSDRRTITYSYTNQGCLETITTGGLTYVFTYNAYGDVKTISVGGVKLLENVYKNETKVGSDGVYTGLIDHTNYSYGTITFGYDEELRVNKMYYDGFLVKEYTYNEYGSVVKLIDNKANVTYYYNYDYKNRIININASNGNNVVYTYNEDELSKVININGLNNYSYVEGKLSEENIADGSLKVHYNYKTGDFDKISSIALITGTSSIISESINETAVKTTNDGVETIDLGRIKEINFKKETDEIFLRYVYSYDENSNILSIIGYEGSTIIYEEHNLYDIFNQLEEQKVKTNNIYYKYNYTYDNRGNILSYTVGDLYSEEFLYRASYTYKLTGWKDELVSVTINGIPYTINYGTDVNYTPGQPSKYMGVTLNYNFRDLTLIWNNKYEIYATYNSDGIRTSKYVMENESCEDYLINYKLDGTKILQEDRNGVIIKYLYDINDNLVGFIYNNITYRYLKNTQNDIIGIVDNNNEVVVKYFYNAYGELIDLQGNTTLGNLNPFRYRSYYYDVETGWYYLNSRYYNPKVGRFINSDDTDYLGASGTELSYNLFSYCENNPVNYTDPNGTVKINIKWLGDAINIIVWAIPMLYGIAKIWSSVSQTSNKLVSFGDKLIANANKVFKRFDDRLYCMFAKSSTYRLVKTIGKLAGAWFVISSLGDTIEYIIDILDGKWDGYLDTNNFNPKFDLTKDY